MILEVAILKTMRNALKSAHMENQGRLLYSKRTIKH